MSDTPETAPDRLSNDPASAFHESALLERGIAPERLTAIEYDPELSAILAARFKGVRIVQGDAFELAHSLEGVHEPFAAIISGLPLLNFPVSQRRALIDGALARLAPGAPLIQFSYGLNAPVVPPPGHTVHCAALVWANVPPARVWVYSKT